MHHAYLSESVNNYEPTTRHALDMMGGASNQAYAQLDGMVTSQAYMLSTVEYFYMMGWLFFALILVIWMAKPPFAAKAGPGAGH